MISSIPVSDPEVEVSSKAKRRVFTAKYKARILREAEACAGKRGALGALLRREGLYSSHLTSWRREAQAGLEAKKRGPKAKVDARDRRIAQLERQFADSNGDGLRCYQIYDYGPGDRITINSWTVQLAY